AINVEIWSLELPFLTLTLRRETYFDQRPNSFRPRHALTTPFIDCTDGLCGHAQCNYWVFACRRTPRLPFRQNPYLFCLHNWVYLKGRPTRTTKFIRT